MEIQNYVYFSIVSLIVSYMISGVVLFIKFLFTSIFQIYEFDKIAHSNTFVTLENYFKKLCTKNKLRTWGKINPWVKLRDKKDKSYFNMGEGYHLLFIGWFPIFFKFEKTLNSENNYYSKIQILLWSRTQVTELIRTAKEQYESKDKTNIYVNKRDSWGYATSFKPRLWDTIIFDTISDDILSKCHHFLLPKTKETYESRGIPYRLTFLLESPPGCGKTSMIRAIAGKLKFSICLLSFSEKGFNDSDMSKLVMNCFPRTILLVEDLDRAFPKQLVEGEDGKKVSLSEITMSGLLNALDGLCAPENQIIFFTTNHLEKLDDALIRAGRVDHVVHIDLASRTQMERLFQKFYPNSTKDEATQFTIKIPEKTLSMAALQGYLLTKGNAQEAIKNVKDLFVQDKKEKNE